MMPPLKINQYMNELVQCTGSDEVESLLIEVCEKAGMPELYSMEEILAWSEDNESAAYILLLREIDQALTQ